MILLDTPNTPLILRRITRDEENQERRRASLMSVSVDAQQAAQRAAMWRWAAIAVAPPLHECKPRGFVGLPIMIDTIVRGVYFEHF